MYTTHTASYSFTHRPSAIARGAGFSVVFGSTHDLRTHVYACADHSVVLHFRSFASKEKHNTKTNTRRPSERITGQQSMRFLSTQYECNHIRCPVQVAVCAVTYSHSLVIVTSQIDGCRASEICQFHNALIQ
mgnify:CR=1 FL=1